MEGRTATNGDRDPVSWPSELARARNLLQQSNNVETSVLNSFRRPLESWTDLIFLYIDYICRAVDGVDDKPSSISDAEKAIILETRAALRFGLCILSCPDEMERQKLQLSMVITHQWHHALVKFISQEQGDSKCLLFAARLLSNIVTANSTTASEVSSFLPLSISKEELSHKLKNELLDDSHTTKGMKLINPNWSSMLISSSRRSGPDREYLAAVVAALHNCLAALPSGTRLDFSMRVASDSMLTSTLLRQLVSVEAVKHSIMHGSTAENKKETNWDAATEWIFLLLVQLFQFGLLPNIYLSLLGASSSSESIASVVVPEQNVLLHCAAQEAHSYLLESTTPANPGGGDVETKNPFGGKQNWESMKTTYNFLVQLLCHHSSENAGIKDHIGDLDVANGVLARSIALSSLEVLCTSLGAEDDDSAKLREYLGSKTTLIQTSSRILGAMVDDLTARSHGLKARDLKMSEEEQKWMTSLVRLLGNMCFHCRCNQDLLRMTPVPTDSQSGEVESRSGEPTSRNSLHVLLSSTSFATSCFTLREWGVIAIRNALENNETNQQIVAGLDAQDPIQSAALANAGVKVQMDKYGKVSLSTVNENGDHEE